MIKRMRKWLDAKHNQRQFDKVKLAGAAPQPLIRGRVRISVDGEAKPSLMIGSKVVINSGIWANPVSGLQTTLLFMNSNASIAIGDGTMLSNLTISSAVRVTIGNEVMLGAGTKVFDSDFHSIYLRCRLPANVGIVAAAVTIEDGAFIGADATILKGVTIGKQAVVGAGAVVTKSIPAFEIWAGNPARKIGSVGDAPVRLPPKFIF